MKKRIPTFLAGMLTMALVCGLSVSALAASGLIQLDVRPINVMVKGEQFKPKDANGEDVLVFTYQGTTYAPLRALAEAYGLEVGYDAAANMATVNEPGNTTDTLIPNDGVISEPIEMTFEEFKAFWKYDSETGGREQGNRTLKMICPEKTAKEMWSIVKGIGIEAVEQYFLDIAREFAQSYEDYPGVMLTVEFVCGDEIIARSWTVTSKQGMTIIRD